MTNPFGQLDDIDRKAIREGSAISRLQAHSKKRGGSKVATMKNRKKGRRKKEEEVDILQILNIIQGK